MAHTAFNREVEEEDDKVDEAESSRKRLRLTYEQLRERGFKGTRYDAELVRDQGLYDRSPPQTSSAPSPKIPKLDGVENSEKGPPAPLPPPVVAPKRPILTAAAKKCYDSPPPVELDVTMPGTIRIHQRALRSTPDRLRKRCQLGRAASDSSSGISDDGASSTHSGSSSDSGIETSSLDGASSVLLERGVRGMTLDHRDEHDQQHHNHQGVKLTLRMKRPTLDEVTSEDNKTASRDGNVTAPPAASTNEYEVLRMEGVGNSGGWPRKRKGSRKRETSSSSTSSTGLTAKRLKLRLGDETMSTIDLDQIG